MIQTSCRSSGNSNNIENLFVKTKSSAVYYVSNGMRFHCASCKPCGPTRSVCDGSLKVREIDECELERLSLQATKYNCELQTPGLWEGQIFVNSRHSLRVNTDYNSLPHINILMTGVQRDFTGGPLSIMHFANELIINGFKVRWINVDGEGLKEKEFRNHAKKYSFLRKFVEEVEFIYDARSSSTTLYFHPNDIFVATLYYTAQIAHFTAKSQGLLQKNFIYFIQDFEPIFFPYGSDFIHAHESYEFPHFPIISTDFLHIWFREKKYGLYKHVDVHTADQLSFAAQPAIKRWPQLNKNDFVSRSRTRVLISYARKHADRNSYALLIDSLSVAVCEGIFKGNWRFMGLGSLRDYKLYLGTHCGKKVLFDVKVNIP